MVNLGRQPLATSMGFTLPKAIDDERTMWTLAADLARVPYRAETAAALDGFRGKDDALTVDIRGMTIEARPAERNSAGAGARHRAPQDR